MTRFALVAPLALVVVSGCSDKSMTSGSAPLAEDSGTGGALGTGGAPAVCTGPGYSSDGGAVSFAHLSAKVTDLDGNAVPQVPAQACGVNLCLNGTTDSTGAVTIDESGSIVRPAFKYGGGQHYAKFALPLSGPTPLRVDLGDVTTVPFDAPETGVTVTPGSAATSNGVTLLVPAGASFSPDPLDYGTDDLRKFRAALIPADRAPKAVDASLGFSIVVALTPAGATMCPAAKLRVPNSASLPAKSRVEFFVHGTEVDEQWAPYGGFAKVSEGVVTDDATSVETDDAQGLPILSVVGIRAAQ